MIRTDVGEEQGTELAACGGHSKGECRTGAAAILMLMNGVLRDLDPHGMNSG